MSIMRVTSGKIVRGWRDLDMLGNAGGDSRSGKVRDRYRGFAGPSSEDEAARNQSLAAI
jgi:hypothetical protein